MALRFLFPDFIPFSSSCGQACRLIFCAGVQILDQLEHSSPVWLRLDFSKDRFQSDNPPQADQVIIRAG